MDTPLQCIRAALDIAQKSGVVSQAECQAEIAKVIDKPRRHIDDSIVDVFAWAMKRKLAAARVKGRSGWEQLDPMVLSQMLHEQVIKGDPVDVANFCCFLWARDQPISGISAEALQRAHENGYAEGLAAGRDAEEVHS